MKTIIIIVLIILAIVFIYMRFIATSGFIVKEYGINSNNLPTNFNGLKIAHLSDIHFATVGKEKLDKIVNEVNIMKPDIVVFTGDLYDEFTNLTDANREEIKDALNKIEAKLGKYAVSGNHDYAYEGYKELIEDSGFVYLDSDKVTLYNDSSTPIVICGYPSYLKDEPDYDIDIPDYFKIALIHEPDAIDSIIDKDFDIVLAGHSHGGQVRLPFIGAIRKVEGSKKYYDEYYNVSNSSLYISYGLGETMLKVRFFDRPSYNMYRIYTK